jgi:hypothetical protein
MEKNLFLKPLLTLLNLLCTELASVLRFLIKKRRILLALCRNGMGHGRRERDGKEEFNIKWK